MRLALWVMLAALAVPPAAAQTIITADYARPVSRYGHDALGPGHEWGALEVQLHDGRRLRFSLPETLVYEDIAPRLADLTGDGLPEVLVVESSLTQGSRLAVYSSKGRMAATAFIGARNRWLAPVGVADLDGDGTVELVYIETPHLAKVLKVVHLSGATLTPVAELAGLTNHHLGSAAIESAILSCGSSAVVLVADADWGQVMAVRLVQGNLVADRFRPYTGPESFANLPICN